MFIPSINQHIDLAPTIRLLYGRAVLAHSLPTMLPCLSCEHKRQHRDPKRFVNEIGYTLRVMSAPEGGLNWYCFKCKRSWDSIELIAQRKYKGDIRAAVHAIQESSDFQTPPEAFAGSAVEDYISEYVGVRKRTRSWSKSSSKRWIEQRDIYHILGKYLGIKVQLLESEASAERGVGQWMRATGYKEICELLNNDIPTNLSPYVFGTCLAIPWSTTLGRTTALLLLGWKNSIRMWFPSNRPDDDPGVMLLNALPPKPNRVLALSSPYMALWLQHKQLQECNTPASVVAWAPGTSSDIWTQIGAKEVVFWGYTPTPAMFKQALAVQGSKVSWIDKPIFEVEYEFDVVERGKTWDAFRNILDAPMPAKHRIHDLTHRMREPYEACREYLLRLNPEEITAAVNLMELTTLQINRLLDEADPVEKKYLEPMLRHPEVIQEIPYGGGKAIQVVGPKESEWFFCKGKTYKERVSNAVVSLAHSFYDESGIKHYVGTAHYKGEGYPFSSSEVALQKNPVKAIMDAVERGCGESPKVNMTHATRLWDFMWNFSPTVKTVRSITKVGWDREKHDFTMPKFIIRNGGIHDGGTEGVVGGTMPCASLSPPTEPSAHDFDTWLEPTDCNGAMWAVIAAATDNILAYTRHEPPRGIGLVGALANAAAAKFSSDLGLVLYTVDRVNEDPVKFNSIQTHHDMPVYITEAESRRSLPANVYSWMLTSGSKNVLMNMSRAQAAAVAMSGDWVVIDTNQDAGSYGGDGSIAGILIHYLAHYQMQIARADRSNYPIRDTLLTIMKWVNETSSRSSSYIENYALDVITDSGRISGAVRFVHMIGQMIQDGYIKHGYGPSHDIAAVTVDSERNVVYVSKQKLIETMFKRRLPFPDTVGMTQELHNEGVLLGHAGRNKDIWTIDLPFWNSEMRRWHKSANPTAGV